MAGMFRNLRADEIDVRVGTDNQYGVTLLLYKDARCDMNILDETVGAHRWQRRHSRDNRNCEIGIFFPDLGWVWKEDTGVESNTEAEKGLASDSFKRSGVNWGIGRELYTAPVIKLNADAVVRNSKGKCATRFTVKEITYSKSDEILDLVITDARGKVMYTHKGERKLNERVDDTPAEEVQAAQTAQKTSTVVKTERVVEQKPLAQRVEEAAAPSELTAYKYKVWREVCNELGMTAQNLLANASQLANAGIISGQTDFKKMNRDEFDNLVNALRLNFRK